MFRRLLFVTDATSVALSACTATPAAPVITDPKEILTKSVLSLKDVKTFHFKADVGGEINLDLTGSGTPGALNLQGTTAEGDVDIAGKKIHTGFAAPALLGVTGDIIIVGNDTYTKISLLGPKYTKSTTTDVGSPAAAAGDPQKVIDEIQKFLNTPGVAPTKLADEKCGDKDCYHVQLTLTSEQLGGITGGGLSSAAPTGSGTVDVWVQKNDLHPSKLTVAATAGDMGKITITMALTNYDAAVTVNPPAATDIEASATDAPSAAPTSS